MSTLFEQASLVMIPSGYKEDVVYSVKPTDGSGDLTFTRASDGTRVNSQGLVERVPWNLLLQSNTFSTTWTTTNATVTSGQSGYDGSSDAWLLETTSAGLSLVTQIISSSGLQTFSVYAKAGTTDWMRINILQSGTNGNNYYDIANGVKGASPSASIIDDKIESVGNGWYRISVVVNFSITQIRIQAAVADGNETTSVGDNIYIQDAQLNEGSLKPYFPTTDRQNVPRLDYSNGCPSLLLEPQRTNLLTYSEQIDNAAWTKGNTTVTANQTTSPDGTQNADSLIEQAVNGIHYAGQGIASASASTYAFSCFLKQGTQQYGGFRAVVNGFANRYFVLLDLSNGSVVDTETIGTGVTWSHNVESFANGWYLLTITAPHTSGNLDLSISPSDSASPSYSLGLPSYNGNTSKNIYAWGAQIEAGSYPTSYIPTTSASVTRVADFSSNSDLLSSPILFGASDDFTLFYEGSFDDLASNNNMIMGGGASSGGASYKSYWWVYPNAGTIRITGEGEVAMANASVTLSNNTDHKLLVRRNGTVIDFFVNGTKLTTTQNTTNTPFAIRSIGWSYNNTVYKVSGNIKQVVVFPSALTDSEATAITT